MALATLTPSNRAADISVGGTSYKTVLSGWDAVCRTPQIDTSTVGTDANGDYEAGRTFIALTLRGILKQGSAVAGPMIPPPNNVVVLLTWHTGCTVSATYNFEDGSSSFDSGQVSPTSAHGISRSAITVAWVTA